MGNCRHFASCKSIAPSARFRICIARSPFHIADSANARHPDHPCKRRHNPDIEKYGLRSAPVRSVFAVARKRWRQRSRRRASTPRTRRSTSARSCPHFRSLPRRSANGFISRLADRTQRIAAIDARGPNFTFNSGTASSRAWPGLLQNNGKSPHGFEVSWFVAATVMGNHWKTNCPTVSVASVAPFGPLFAWFPLSNRACLAKASAL